MQQATQTAMATPVSQPASALNPFTFMRTADSGNFTYNLGQATAILGVTIPAHTCLVIQYVSVDVALQTLKAALVHLTTTSTAPGSTPVNNHFLLLTPVQLGQGNVQWICSEQVSLYAESAQFTISVGAVDGKELGTVNASATVSGYLVDL